MAAIFPIAESTSTFCFLWRVRHKERNGSGENKQPFFNMPVSDGPPSIVGADNSTVSAARAVQAATPQVKTAEHDADVTAPAIFNGRAKDESIVDRLHRRILRMEHPNATEAAAIASGCVAP
jgi:hypothetical protein